jgi:endonuclease/exonuclease/phosphatase family metal-dependent hydrolase
MWHLRALLLSGVCVFFAARGPALRAADTFSVATYNLENYLEESAGSRHPKTEAAKDKIREMIRALKPDVLAVEEIGGTNTLLELRSSLRAEGLNYPHWSHVAGFDTNIHVAVLSRFPFLVCRPHTNEGFLLNGRRFRVSRGFAEVDVQVNAEYKFTLIAAHLKSRREVPQADEADLREQEAAMLREIIDARLRTDPNLNLIVLGDFNDLKDSKPIRTIIGRGKNALIDTRPAENNGELPLASNRPAAPRNVTWTYYFGKDDTYSRIDYLLLNRGMAREWQTNATYVLALPGWGLASDHRPIIASFLAKDK